MVSPDDAARALLIKKADGYFWGLIWSTVILLLGAIMEEVHPLNRLPTHNVNTRTRARTPRRWVLRSKRAYEGLAVVFVVGGIGGEGIFEYLGAKAETAVRNFDNGIAVKAEAEAGSAEKSAKGAAMALGTVERSADALGTRLDVASAQMDGLDTRIAAQGARAKLLVKAAPELFKKLTPFAGQRVRLFVCGQEGVAEQETIDTWAAIANILGSETVEGVVGSNWKIVPPNLGFASNCGAAKGLGHGVMVFVSKQASRHAMDAADALGRGLEKALPSSPNKMPGLVDPVFARSIVNRGLAPKDEPWNLVASDQDLITVMVGEHP